ncbi:MAG: carboxymuconolactone decarboxylase family protein [Ilumatobacteraceae bacterium]
MTVRIDEATANAALTAVAPELGTAVTDFMRLAYTGSTVDVVTRELVRIYSGQQTRCRFCSNTRVRGAVERGMDETVVAKVEDFEHSDLPERQRAALRLARSFLLDPAAFGPDDLTALAVHFGPDQIAELVLDLIRLRPGSKLHIATGMDEDVAERILL